MLHDENGKLLAYDLGSSLDTASDKLAKGVIELFHDQEQRRSIGKNLGILIRNKYAPEKISRAIIEFYSDCLYKKCSQ